MKAVLLAAGKGERLGRITKAIPKPMLQILGKPIIMHNIEMCKNFGITDIYINLHYLHDVITNYLGDGGEFGVSITYSQEKELLGTAGGVKNFANELARDKFFVIYADTVYNYDLGVVYQEHCIKNADMSIVLFELDDVTQSGVVFMDGNNLILDFIEKPKNELNSNWVNTGIYLMEPELLDLIPHGFCDFATDIIPAFIKSKKNVYGVKMQSETLPIDTSMLYKKALEAEGEFFNKEY